MNLSLRVCAALHRFFSKCRKFQPRTDVSVGLLIAITTACFICLTVFFRELDIPHDHSGGFLNLHIQGMLACFVLAACLLALFINRVARNLRYRDAHLAELHQQGAEEEHIVRMGLLASGAAHELGTPLSTLSVILGDWARTEKIREDVNLSRELAIMQAQLDRCKKIVSGILMSSGEARGEGTVHTSVCGFFEGLAIEWRNARAPANFRFHIRFEPDQPMVSDLALKQVIFNVLDNAIEASPEFLSLDVRREGDAVVVTDVDQGTGFAADVLSRMGKPYATTKDRPGAGLGLFLVVNVIRKLGGTVTAANRQERGARAEIRLPVAVLSGGDK